MIPTDLCVDPPSPTNQLNNSSFFDLPFSSFGSFFSSNGGTQRMPSQECLAPYTAILLVFARYVDEEPRLFVTLFTYRLNSNPILAC